MRKVARTQRRRRSELALRVTKRSAAERWLSSLKGRWSSAVHFAADRSNPEGDEIDCSDLERIIFVSTALDRIAAVWPRSSLDLLQPIIAAQLDTQTKRQACLDSFPNAFVVAAYSRNIATLEGDELARMRITHWMLRAVAELFDDLGELRESARALGAPEELVGAEPAIEPEQHGPNVIDLYTWLKARVKAGE